MSKIFFLLGLIAACSAGSVEVLPAGHTVVRSFAAPAAYYAAPAAHLALPASNLVLSRGLLPSYALAQPSYTVAQPSYALAQPSYAAVRSLLPALTGGYYYGGY